MGDFGRVYWKAYDGSGNVTVVASAGAGGYGDFTDGVLRNISEILSVANNEGGSDIIVLNDGDDVGIGGFLNDTLDGGGGRDILFGDSAVITYYPASSSPELLMTIDCEFGGRDILYGGPGLVDYLVGGSFDDDIWGNDTYSVPDLDQEDLVIGDHGKIVLAEEPAFKLLQAETIYANCTGGNDQIILGPGKFGIASLSRHFLWGHLNPVRSGSALWIAKTYHL